MMTKLTFFIVSLIAFFSINETAIAKTITVKVGATAIIGTATPSCAGTWATRNDLVRAYHIKRGWGKIRLGKNGKKTRARGGRCRGELINTRPVLYTPSKKARGVTLRLRGRNVKVIGKRGYDPNRKIKKRRKNRPGGKKRRLRRP